jgi:hypothetical protein
MSLKLNEKLDRMIRRLDPTCNSVLQVFNAHAQGLIIAKLGKETAQRFSQNAEAALLPMGRRMQGILSTALKTKKFTPEPARKELLHFLPKALAKRKKVDPPQGRTTEDVRRTRIKLQRRTPKREVRSRSPRGSDAMRLRAS